MKNKIFTIILMVMLLCPVFAEQNDISEAVTEDTKQEMVMDNEEDFIQYKQPVSKRKIAKKFLLAMSGVGISSILLFFFLTLYNKIRERILNGTDGQNNQNETSLYVPKDYNEAVKNFLEKTDWQD